MNNGGSGYGLMVIVACVMVVIGAFAVLGGIAAVYSGDQVAGWIAIGAGLGTMGFGCLLDAVRDIAANTQAMRQKLDRQADAEELTQPPPAPRRG